MEAQLEQELARVHSWQSEAPADIFGRGDPVPGFARGHLRGRRGLRPPGLAEAFFKGGERDPAEAHAQPVAAPDLTPQEASEDGGGQGSHDAATARPARNSGRRLARK
jgi:hypothetical protein